MNQQTLNAPADDKTDQSEKHASLHAKMSAVASAEGALYSNLKKTVSVHAFNSTISFSTVQRLHVASRNLVSNAPLLKDFVGVDGQRILYSAAFCCSGQSDQQPRSKKRVREDDFEESASRAVQKVTRVAPGSALPKKEADVAQEVLTRLLRDVRGPSGEILVQSFGIFVKKKRESDNRPSLIIAARMHGGVGVPVASMKRAFGDCWQDGAFSTDDKSTVLMNLELPSTPAAETARLYGQSSLFFVTSISHFHETSD